MAAKKFNRDERAQALHDLKDALAGATKGSSGRPIIYTILRKVNAGMTMRHISALVIDAKSSQPIDLTFDYCKCDGDLPVTVFTKWAVKMPGGGMDMGFHLAGNIASLAEIGNFQHEWL